MVSAWGGFSVMKKFKIEKTRFMDLFNEIENDNLKEKANLVVFNNNPI
jgi:hypothetical protein